MGTAGVLHKSQSEKGTHTFFERQRATPTGRPAEKGVRPLFGQWPSEPAARRISAGASCDSSLRYTR